MKVDHDLHMIYYPLSKTYEFYDNKVLKYKLQFIIDNRGVDIIECNYGKIPKELEILILNFKMEFENSSKKVLDDLTASLKIEVNNYCPTPKPNKRKYIIQNDSGAYYKAGKKIGSYYKYGNPKINYQWVSEISNATLYTWDVALRMVKKPWIVTQSPSIIDITKIGD